jgi:subtilase family serine protease
MLGHPQPAATGHYQYMRKEMRILLRTCIRRGLFVAGWYIPLSLLAVASFAQQPAERIKAEVDDTERTTIPGSHSPLARAENETGRMAAGTALQGINIVFSRTPAQEADLQALLAAQQDPTSPSYHQWLTPEEFGARFGVADADIAKVRSWLEKRGFTVEGVSRSKNRIRFSGTVEQVEATFGTEMHYYKVEGETHFAPSQDVSVPAALSSLVLAVTNLSTFRPKPHVRFKGPQPVVRPDFTSSQTQNHFLTPKDVATIYDMNAAYNAGYNGADQSIAVVGQSDIVMADIENFQKAAGFPVKDPVRVLASSTPPGIVSGDEAESDIDLEYTSTIANGATIYFVYSTLGAFDAINYAVLNKTAPIISISYGVCEASLASSEYTSVNGILAQAAAQGQSVIAASGDSGSADCYVNSPSGSPKSTNAVLAVDFPSSSQYVTGMGGTEFPAADVASTNTTYWQAAVGSDVISSALKYIPELVWNDDTASTSGTTTTVTISAGGGGVSTLTPRPTWQTGVPGIPSGTFRFVPDISLSSSPANAPYLLCSSDTKWTGVTGSCSNGFRDSNNTNLTVAGGTSFAAPVFAGMLAIINQKLGSTGQGVVNSTLYMLAANATTYASAFHDITSGGNECNLGTTYCSTASASGYTATTGYDEASGLGSIDFFNLLSAWPGSSKLAASKTTLVAANATPAPGANDVITITVASASASSTTTPTGTLTIVVDGTTATSSLALVSGSATYTFSSTTAGAHAITATYSGDSTYAASNASLTVTVTAVASQTTVSAATTTPAVGANDLVTITVASGSASSTATPTGTLTIAIDNTPQSPTLTLASGSATYTYSSAAPGPHTIMATYAGDSIYAGSTGMLTVTVATKSFKVAANAVTVASGSSGTTAVTITPQGGYTGTIAWTVSSSPALTNGCFSMPNTSVSGSSGVNATLTVFTVASSCPAPAVAGSGSRHSGLGSGPISSGNVLRPFSALHAIEVVMAMAGLLLFGLVGRRHSPRLGIVAAACMLVAIGLVTSGCSSGGGSSSSPPPPSAAKGTYTVTIVGADTVSSSITATTTITLTIN